MGDFTAMLEHVDGFRSTMLGFMQDYDVIVCPVAAFPAQPHGESLEDRNQAGHELHGDLQRHGLAVHGYSRWHFS